MSDLGYPMIQAHPDSWDAGRQGYSIIWITVHCTDQAYQDNYPERLGQYWSRPPTGSPVSVHYGISDTQTYQYVWHKDTAYQARNPGNLRGIGIEFSGLSSYPPSTWNSHDAMLRRGGTLISQIAAKHGIPLKYCSDDDLRERRPGLTTHAQLTRVFGGTHTDPGAGFPLKTVLQYAQGQPAQEDDMGMFLGPFEIPVEGVWTGPISPVQVGAANPRPGWINIGNDTFDVDYQVRLFVSSGNGGFGPLEKLGFLNRDGSSSVLQGQNGVFTLKSGVIYWDQLTKGTRIASIQRQGTYKGRLEFGVEYGEVER